MTNGKGDESADKNRVARDYAFSRLEQLELSDLQGYSLQDVKEVEEAFHSSQLELLVSLSKGERDAEMEISRQFQTKVKSIKQRLINVESKKDEKTVSTVSVKLPKINIKPFDGKIENWVSFVQIFDSLIHKRDIPPVEKLHYLLSSVQGDAYNLIKNYPLSDENYILAYNNLRSHYNQKRLIASTFYEKLLTCEPSKTRSSSDLNRIHRTFRENVEILSKFNLPDTNFMLFHLLWSKLDPSTKEAFELQLASNSEIPDFYFLFHFIEKRSHALENSMVKSSANNIAKPSTSYTKPPAPKNKSSLIVPHVVGCASCSATCHKVDKCPELLKLSPSERFAKIKEKRLCILCFQPSHTVKLCKAKSSVCEKCSNRHHILLHFDSQNNNTESQVESPEAQPSAPSSLAVSGSDTHLLFATAVVRIKNNQNKFVPIRIVLDNASACNIMSQKCANKLGLEIQGSKSSVHGVGRVSSETLGSVSCEIIPFKGDHTSPTFSLNASVMPQIVSEVPTAKLDISLLDHIKDLDLADPHFFKPGPVDMLVSVQLLAQALLPGFAQGTADQPIALRTVFGWIVMGACAAETGSSRSRSRPSVIKDCLLVSNMSLDNNIKRFWELENINNSNVVELSKSEMLCENYMETSYHRNSEGKMVVPLTFENPQEKPVFSNTREIALRRFFNLEKKFKLNPRFHEAYVKYMLDYLESGHMEEVLPPSKPIGHYYYVPQFGILRDSVTTPLRPVCDASCPDSSGLSLNNTLLPGPKLQKNIFDLLTRFRWHAVVFTGDIKQMYRQFLVDLEDCEYQHEGISSSTVFAYGKYPSKTVLLNAHAKKHIDEQQTVLVIG
ncbi:putative peptidase (DUF1758) domain-containing protein [Phthorimaea operculella]|nr:putative peptidase (DUF1758) domain-containing protein [Phthorimaea operculella]